MNTFLSLLVWGGIGVSVGLGIVAVVLVAVFLSNLYAKICPKEKPTNFAIV